MLDFTKLRFTAAGRPVIDDAALAAIEASFGAHSVAGAGTNARTCPGNNEVCRNTGDCGDSTNGTCTNTGRSCRTQEE